VSAYRVSVKGPDDKRSSWLGMGGRVTRLLIHAVQFDDKDRADKVAAEIVSDNPGYSAEAREIK
jgi:hypothetical protein